MMRPTLPILSRTSNGWKAFRKRGFTTQQLPNNGKPLMYGEYPRKVAGAKTVLF